MIVRGRMSRSAGVAACTVFLTNGLLVSGLPASAQSITPAISVTGEATIAVTPDIATIDGGVTSVAKTAREAADANNTTMGAVLLALKAAGLSEKKFQTSRLSLQPQSGNRTPNGPTQIISYRATNHVVVTLHDVSKVAGVIDTLVATGANEIGSISFSVEQTSKLLDEARAQALADAQRKAEIYAKAANVALGLPITITENAPIGLVPLYNVRSRLPGDAASTTPIAPGEETLRVSVSVSYAIKQP